VTLGQEFGGYAAQVRHAEERLHRSLHVLGELAIGGTAVGTGINTHPDFGSMVAAELVQRTGIHFREAANHFEAQHTRDAIVGASGNLRTIAVGISKIVSDIRLMGCGPRCGIGELKLPAIQPGSSIMPGKVNPVIVESAMMVCCQVIGNDQAITIGGMGGVGSLLDLNVAMPMMIANLLDSIGLLANTADVMVDKLLTGLEADEKRCAELIEGSLAMCTSLVPAIGYDKAAALAYEAYREGKTIRQLAREQKLLSDEELNRLLDPMSMTEPTE
jgi:fumarate hydratase class II